MIKAIANHFITKRNLPVRVSGVAAMLVIAPLLGMTAGFVAQSKENHLSQISNDFNTAQKRAYKSFTDQIIADPGIALRENWYEKPDPSNWSPELAARDMVFRASFQPERDLAPYTPAQLDELAQVSPEARTLVAYHPACSARLIEEVWSEVMRSGQSSAMEAIILNPATPRHLLENYAKDQKISAHDHNGWLERLVLKRLDQKKPN